jgi:hypothetical protein
MAADGEIAFLLRGEQDQIPVKLPNASVPVAWIEPAPNNGGMSSRMYARHRIGAFWDSVAPSTAA